MQVLGTVNIGTNIEHADRVDASHHIYHSQTTITQGAVSQDDADNAITTPLSSTPTPQIRLNPKKGMRINLFRIIVAMHEYGFFLNTKGGIADQQEVFSAFAEMLGEEFKRYNNNLSGSKNHNNDSDAPSKIFDDLKRLFLETHD